MFKTEHTPLGVHSSGIHAPSGVHSIGVHYPSGVHSSGVHDPQGVNCSGVQEPLVSSLTTVPPSLLYSCTSLTSLSIVPPSTGGSTGMTNVPILLNPDIMQGTTISYIAPPQVGIVVILH